MVAGSIEDDLIDAIDMKHSPDNSIRLILIFELFKQGYSRIEIANKLKISRYTVSKDLKRFMEARDGHGTD